jgi:hypothetical protein
MQEFFGKIVLIDEFFTLILEYNQPCIENISKRTKVPLAGQKRKAKAQAVKATIEVVDDYDHHKKSTLF